MNLYTNKNQFEFLMDWMCKNPQLPRNQLKYTEAKEQYEELSFELNRLGPPQKPVETWKKVWSDLRCTTKRKVRENLINDSNLRYNERDRRIIELLDMENEVRDNMRTGSSGSSWQKLPNVKRQKLNENDGCFDDDFEDDDDDHANAVAESLENENSNLEESVNNYIRKIKSNNSLENCFDESKSDFIIYDECEETENSMPDTTIDAQKAPLNVMNDERVIDLLKKQLELQQQQLSQQQATLRVLSKIERQLFRRNQTDERSNTLLEDNNKLMKLLIYRSTMTENKKNPYEKLNSDDACKSDKKEEL